MELLPHEQQIHEYEKSIAKIKEQNKKKPLLSSEEVRRIEKKLEKLREEVYASLTPWDRVLVCRHPERPRSSDFIAGMSDTFVELFGDRTFRDDAAIVGGLATIGGIKCVIAGQEKGHDTESRLKRNFGMLHPEGFRKALRLAQLAEKFSLPLVFLLDTPGAHPGLTAEERGQAWAIALNLRELSRIKTPIVTLVIGEGCSGGALGMGVGDAVGMLEHAYYSVISPEGCASILWKDATKKRKAASTLRMHAEDLLAFEIIDAIIKEPPGGAHRDPAMVYEKAKSFIVEQIDIYREFSDELLLEHRYEKFRKIGRFDEAST